MTYRATFRNDDGSMLVMIVGDSYKKWFTQLTEFVYRHYGSKTEGWRYKDIKGRLVKLERCRSHFVGGSLKWCPAEKYQEELNDEARRPSEKARQYSDMYFEEISNERALIHFRKYW
jgi:hypothetical protein